MKNQSVILVIWIGKFPKSFNMWLHSISLLPFDFIFYTDQPKPINISYKWNYTSMNSLKNQFSAFMKFDVELPFPYKICDYRPAFGEMFYEEVKEYKYWGYCDLDVIFGNCDIIQQKIEFLKPDKVLQRGHLSFFKNNLSINAIYKSSSSISFNYIFQNSKYCMFDEWHGIGKILREKNKTIFHEELVVDINPNSYLFKASNIRNYSNQIFVYDNNKVFQYFLINGIIHKNEFCYIHFQKRDLDFSEFDDPSATYVFTSKKIFKLNKRVTVRDIYFYNQIDLIHFLKRNIDRIKVKINLKTSIFDQYLMLKS